MTCKSVQLWRSRPCQSGSLLLLVTHPPAHRLVALSGYYCPWQWGGVASCVFRYSQHGPRLTVRRLAGNGGTTWNCDRCPARGSSASLASATRAILMLCTFRPKHCTIPNIPPLVKPEIVILINNLHFQGILNVDTVLLIMEIIRSWLNTVIYACADMVRAKVATMWQCKPFYRVSGIISPSEVVTIWSICHFLVDLVLNETV